VRIGPQAAIQTPPVVEHHGHLGVGLQGMDPGIYRELEAQAVSNQYE